MKASTRHERILAMLAELRRVDVATLASGLSASPETIRRDLSRLATTGALRKIHGGAMLPETRGEGSFQARLSEHSAAKRRIARKAATLFAPGDTIFVDNGTTTLAFAEELAKLPGVTVITNGSLIAGAIAGNVSNGGGSRHGARANFLVGGAFAGDGAETLGPLAHEQLRRFHPKHAVLTIGALDATRGIMDFNLGEAEVARVMVDQARVITILADASKLGRTALFEVCPLSAIDRLVTNASPAADLQSALRAAKVEIILAQAEDQEEPNPVSPK